MAIEMAACNAATPAAGIAWHPSKPLTQGAEHDSQNKKHAIANGDQRDVNGRQMHKAPTGGRALFWECTGEPFARVLLLGRKTCAKTQEEDRVHASTSKHDMLTKEALCGRKQTKQIRDSSRR